MSEDVDLDLHFNQFHYVRRHSHVITDIFSATGVWIDVPFIPTFMLVKTKTFTFTLCGPDEDEFEEAICLVRIFITPCLCQKKLVAVEGESQQCCGESTSS